MDAEPAAVHQALQDLHDQGLQEEDIHVFVDSQAALKRLQKVSLTGGQRVCHEITVLCKMLSLRNNKIHVSVIG
jgi:ribonuclease HI